MSVLCGNIPTMTLVVDDTAPRRRISFGTPEAARAFAESLPGWSVVDPADPSQPPVTGSWTATGD